MSSLENNINIFRLEKAENMKIGGDMCCLESLSVSVTEDEIDCSHFGYTTEWPSMVEDDACNMACGMLPVSCEMFLNLCRVCRILL
jgi:hypothetical protein